MKQIFSIIVCLLAGTIAISQNLIPNSSFEIVQQDTGYNGNIMEAIPWSTANNQGTPDVLTTRIHEIFWNIPINGVNSINSIGYQFARTGNAMSGMVTYCDAFPNIWGWENIMIQINGSLDFGHTYHMGFYTNLSNNSKWAISRIGMYISSTNPYQNMGVLPYIPQIESPVGVYLTDTAGWMLISDTITATGSEQYICIGNFHTQQFVDTLGIYFPYYVPGRRSYYFIDDVFICAIDSTYPVADIDLQDTIICYEDSVYMGSRNDSNYFYRWYPKIGLSSDSTGFTWAKPLITTKYYLEATDDCFSKTYDSVIVYVHKCGPNAGIDTTVCKESQITLGDSSNIGYQCQWQPSTYLSSDTVAMPQMSCMNSMTYYLTVYNGSVIIKTDSIKVIVGDCYYAEAGIDTTICKGDSMQIGSHNFSFVNYLWSPNFMLSDTAIGAPLVFPDTSTYYFLQVTDTMGNISFDSVLVGVQNCDTTGYAEIPKNKKQITIFPNPAVGYMIVEFKELQQKDCKFELYDNIGRKVLKTILKKGKNQYQIRIEKLESGVYFYKLKAGESYNGKIVISK